MLIEQLDVQRFRGLEIPVVDPIIGCSMSDQK